MTAILIVAAGALGLAIGSFLNVVIWRVPRGESLSRPASACPRCGHPIRPRDNVPVLSWLILRGRCRDCGAPISARYPLVELGTAAAFVGVAIWAEARSINGGLETAAGAIALVAYLYLAAISIALALIDLDTHTLPNRIVLPSIVVVAVLLALASVVSGEYGALFSAAVGGAALFACYLFFAIAYPGGMGFGDVKLAAVLGLSLGWLGWGPLVVGAFGAFVLGGVFSIVLLLIGKARRRTGIPFGPWMLAGAWVGVFAGDEIAHGYLSLVGLN